MTGVIRFIAGVLLIAHGLVHLLYVAPDVEEFALDRSWLVPEAVRRPLASVLMVATVAAFVLVGLAVWGVPLVSGVWPVLTIVASLLSLALLVSFWNPRLIVGVAIDLLLLAVAIIQPTWMARVG